MEQVSVDDLLGMTVGTRLLLPNTQAAAEMRQRFQEQGLETSSILSWAQWTNSFWSELVVAGLETRLLLNAAQESTLWREIVAEDSAGAASGSAQTLAELAASGWKLAAEYEITGRLRSAAGSHDSRVFAEWAETFSRRCGSKGYLPAAALEEALRLHVRHGGPLIDAAVELVGFEAMRPAQLRLLEALRERGVSVRESTLHAHSSGFRASMVATTSRVEMECVARWLRSFVEKQPKARVAVLVPSLAEERAEFEDVLRKVLAPELEDVKADLSSLPWEISGGVALRSVTMVMDMLSLARWVEGALPVQKISSLLLSPYLGSAERRDSAARFDVRLRRELTLRPEMDMSSVFALAEAKGETDSLAWLREVEGFVRRDSDRMKVRGAELRGYAQWMEFVRALGIAAGWPGARDLSATEFATTEAWESALDTVATLDFNGRRVTYATAMEELELHAASAVFARPKTGATIQVMGVAGAEGSVWDALVLMRATDANWPPVERLHPLLPWGLQRSLKMPGSDAGLSSKLAKQRTQGWVQRCGTVLFTSAAEDESGQLRVSPLVAELGFQTITSEVLVATGIQEAQISLEIFEDGEQLPSLPSMVVGGGANVLKLQAACGFLAFADLRLKANEPEHASLGLDPGENGSVLHKAMQAFWRGVKSQSTLQAMAPGEREARLAEAIDGALPRRLKADSGWDIAYVQVVKERLRSVLRQWLEMELERGPFEVIDVEHDADVMVGPLRLSVRMDRVDKVGDGVFFVDYKTGYTADPKQWVGERPDDPQLPLYALLPEQGEVKGMAFAKVRTGKEMKWVGYQAEEGILPASKSKTNIVDMDALVEEWRGTLTILAEGFASGRAYVRPKSYEVNCTRCGQRLLCRLDPTTLLAAEDDGEDEQDLDG